MRLLPCLYLITTILLFFSCQKKDSEQYLVFQITNKFSADTSYLIGGVHYIPEGLYNREDAEKFHYYIDRCASFVLEANIDSFNLVIKNFKKEFDIKSNNEILSKDELEYLTCFLRDSLNYEKTMIDKILSADPLQFESTIEKDYIKQKYFLQDHYLKSYAKYRKKEIKYLDTPERYYYYFCQYSLKSYTNPWFKNDSIKNIHFKELFEVWNDYTGLKHVDFNSINNISDSGLILKRNLEWINIIPQLIGNGTCAILVGNAHIENLTDLLSDAGFRVTPVYNIKNPLSHK